jgi:hypothetical protein
MSAKAQKKDPAAAPDRFVPRSDLVTFEVVRHRLWQINDEQGRSIINV